MRACRVARGCTALALLSLAGSALAAGGTLYRWGDALPPPAVSAAPASASSASAALRAAQCALHMEQLASYRTAESIQDMEAHGEMRAYGDDERSELIEAAKKAIAAACQS
jgi:hypothetical protein